MKNIIIFVVVLTVCAVLYFTFTDDQVQLEPTVSTESQIDIETRAPEKIPVSKALPAAKEEKAPVSKTVPMPEEQKAPVSKPMPVTKKQASPETPMPPFPIPVYVNEDDSERRAASRQSPSLEEQVERVNKKIEEIELEFDWDNERTVDITQGILMGVPPIGRSSAYNSFTNALKRNLSESNAEAVTVDEMVRAFDRAFEETQMEDTEMMREMIRNYIEDFEEE